MSEWGQVMLRQATVSLDARRKPVKGADRRSGPYPYYGASGIVDYVDDYLFDETTLLVSEDGENLRTRKTPIAFLASGRYWVNNHVHVLSAAEGFDLRFLAYSMQLVDLTGYLTGSTQPKLTTANLSSIRIAAPPLDEQRRIAGMLGALDDLIDTNRGQVRVLEGLARSLAASVSDLVPLSKVAEVLALRQLRPAGEVEHFSLPAFDAGQAPETVDGTAIQSSKLPVHETCVLVSRLNPKWERCWMVYPGRNAVASTEFVPLVGVDVTSEEVWAVTSAAKFWDQMRSKVTGTTGSHQRVDKRAVLTLSVPDTRALPPGCRDLIADLVREARDIRIEIADLTRTREELLPLLMDGRIRVRDAEKKVEEAI